VILGSRGFQDFHRDVTATAPRFVFRYACPKNPSTSTLSRDFQKFITADFTSDPHLGAAIWAAHERKERLFSSIQENPAGGTGFLR
jgi:hypothetical protein